MGGSQKIKGEFVKGVGVEENRGVVLVGEGPLVVNIISLTFFSIIHLLYILSKIIHPILS